MSDKTYRANYRCDWKSCPTCKEVKLIPYRNKYCSTECYAGRTLVNSTYSVPTTTSQQKDDIVATIVAQVIKSLPPNFLASYAAPVQTPDLGWTRNNFDDGWTVEISDMHIPFHHVKATLSILSFLREKQKEGILKRLVLNGDIFDAAALSRHMKRKRGSGGVGDLGDEIKAGKPIIMAYAKLFDEVYFLGGNHEEGRLQRLLANEGVGIPKDPLAFGELLKFYGYDGITFVDRRDIKLGFDDGAVKMYHGEIYNRNTASTILANNRGNNVTQGHTHRPQLHFSRGQFGAVNGGLIDKNQQDYMADPEWTMGFTIFEHFKNGTQVNPYFVKITEDGEFSFNGKVYTPDNVVV